MFFKTRKTETMKLPDSRNTIFLPLAGTQISYELHISLRARHLRLEIRSETGLRVIAPQNMPPEKVIEFIVKKENWILKHLCRTQQPLPKNLSDGETVLYKGRFHKIRAKIVPGADFSVQLNDTTFDVRLPRASEASLHTALSVWFRRQAKAQIVRETHRLAQEFGLKIGRVSIRSQKTRWGSCSSKRNLNFNWRLLMAPEEVLRYVIIHELTHVNEMSHSGRFWSLMAVRCPQYRQHRKWLKENEPVMRQI
ncbi:hypothetical protein BMS3Bbin03_00634 [bacterium BMS3Bbin03]|nr:hypothetical protein BMS3Bbin03_00634 [bacterium BMS3Bbin03]